MVTLAINLMIYTALFLIIGLIKPHWPLFFMANPSRTNVIFFSIILFMISVTLFGEGRRQNQPAQKPAVKQRVIDDIPKMDP